MRLVKGGNAPLPSGRISSAIVFGADPVGRDVDVSAYVLRSDGRVRFDDDMLFFNQPTRPDGSISLDVATRTFSIDFGRLPSDVERIAICTVVAGGSASVLHSIGIEVEDGPSFLHETEGQPESAVIVAEFYLRVGVWKMRAVGAGFAGGLAPLARHFGVDVEDEPEAPPATSPAVATVAVPSAEPPKHRTTIDLRKDKVSISLEKLAIGHEKADVLMVMDASGSMNALYENGTVQETVERIVPVALRLDEDGELDAWFYASSWKRAGVLREDNVAGFVGREMPYPGAGPVDPKGYDGIGLGNDETAVMEAILGRDDPMRTVPLLVIFVTDGGIEPDASETIKDVLRMASSRAIFWQFVGVGNADYGVLRELDTVSGRRVDNAGFFALDDLSRITDDDLYDRILSEFPIWLKAVRENGILGS